MKFFLKKKLKKKEDRRNKIHHDEVKKKRIRGVSFVDWRSFKTNKRVILSCRELVSRSRDLNQCKSSSF